MAPNGRPLAISATRAVICFIDRLLHTYVPLPGTHLDQRARSMVHKTNVTSCATKAVPREQKEPEKWRHAIRIRVLHRSQGAVGAAQASSRTTKPWRLPMNGPSLRYVRPTTTASANTPVRLTSSTAR
jgi:hypothetical protein